MRLKEILADLLVLMRKTVRVLLKRSCVFCSRVDKRYPFARRAVCAVMSMITVVAISCSILSMAGLTYALAVSVNGTVYGFVGSKEVAQNAIDNLCDSLQTGEDCRDVSMDTHFSYTMVSSDALVTGDQLVDSVVDGESNYVQILGIFADDRLVSYANSASLAEQVLKSLRGENTFFFDIDVRNCVVTKSVYRSLTPLSKLNQCLLPATIQYECVEGDSAAVVADKFGVKEALVQGLNLTATYEADSVVTVVKDLPVTTTVTYSDAPRQHTVAASGTETKAHLVTETVRTYSIDGVAYSRKVVSTTTSELFGDKPIAKVIESVGSYGFCWPVDGAYKQYVSSFWGDGRGHSGYDIAANTGVPILAAKDGVVCSINNSGSGYGQHFEIDHGNGVRTLYAHCSTLYVSLGDHVQRGEVIGLVGSTGYSSGSHLHFEVIVNGQKVNPNTYIGSK